MIHLRTRSLARSLTIGFTVAATVAAPTLAQERFTVASPNGRTVVTIGTDEGRLYYAVDRDNRALMLPSRLGMEFRGSRPLAEGLRITGSTTSSADTTWTQPWGEVARVRDRHNERRLSVSETGATARNFVVVFRVFDDGLGFRYEFPEQPGLGEFAITQELTEFSFVDDARAWWIPSNRPRLDRSEMLYASSPLSVIDSVQTPLTMETRDGRTFIVIHEANLVDYSRMFLAGRGMESRTLRAALAAWADGIKVRGRTPFVTPWRTIQLADRATDLAPSVLGLNLNPPSAIANTDWIKPMKYVGIWWGMHIGTMTWGSGPKHGATTENTKGYIDFAAANELGGVLVEGWNVGWDGDWIANRNAFSFTQPYPDYNLRELAAYAKQKGVKLIAHNERSGGIEIYERQMDSAFALY
ncbi:MAG: glycoside hydrolase family 97 N-terminal domain-containing protein, partial [Gemmatimonadota bacterium]|nr:glycoside hydrolase family 97 N-terminal domain-containing protein [Gemmatimonadota bacterium]